MTVSQTQALDNVRNALARTGITIAEIEEILELILSLAPLFGADSQAQITAVIRGRLIQTTISPTTIEYLIELILALAPLFVPVASPAVKPEAVAPVA